MARRRARTRVQVRRTRRQNPTKLGIKKAVWVDPFPYIPGTEPEKRIFEALHILGIYFKFQAQVPEFEKGGTQYFMAPVGYKPDFVLPEYRIILDPFSPFHHSEQAARIRDADKVARYELIGYKYYHPWALDGGKFQWDQPLMHRFKRRTKITFKLGGKTYTTYKPIWNVAVNGELHSRTMSAIELLLSIPEILAGPKFKLTDPADIKAKQSPGWLIGEFVGAGASGVGAANKARARRGPGKVVKLTLRR